MLKVALVAPCKAEYNKYVIDEVAKAQNKYVLRLLPYHYELNPIDMIWADAKTNTKTFNL